MKDHERTQLSYVAQALVRAPGEAWTSVLDDAEPASDASEDFLAALRAIRNATKKHRELKRVVETLVKSDDPPAVTAGRTLAWSLEELTSQAPQSVRPR